MPDDAQSESEQQAQTDPNETFDLNYKQKGLP